MVTTTVKKTPASQVVKEMLAGLNVLDYDPQVISAILQLAYSTTRTILKESRKVAKHNKKKRIGEAESNFAGKYFKEQHYPISQGFLKGPSIGIPLIIEAGSDTAGNDSENKLNLLNPNYKRIHYTANEKEINDIPKEDMVLGVVEVECKYRTRLVEELTIQEMDEEDDADSEDEL